MSGGPRGEYDEAFWREFLTRGDPMERRARRVLRLLPHGPRCKLCAAPFAGVGSPLMRAIGKRPAIKNSTVCNSCYDFMEKHHGGAEIEGSFLFADIRGSTSLAERMPPAAFRALIDRFYATATQAVFENDGGIDKFVGDEVVAFFFPLISARVMRRPRSVRPLRCYARPAMRMGLDRGYRSVPGSPQAWHGSAPSGTSGGPT